MAAGMGSRYGGLKQLDEFGPNGETIIDYSIYDAIRAGFGKVVLLFCAQTDRIINKPNVVNSKRLIYLNSKVNLVKYGMKPVNHLPKNLLTAKGVNQTES